MYKRGTAKAGLPGTGIGLSQRRLAMYAVAASALTCMMLAAAVFLWKSGHAAPLDMDGFTVDSIAYDMYGAPCRSDETAQSEVGVIGGCPWGRHEALPQRLPTTVGFYYGAQPVPQVLLQDKYVVPGGQIYAAQPKTRAWDVRVQVDDQSLWVLREDDTWHELKPAAAPRLEGEFWDSNFVAQTVEDTEKGIRQEGGYGQGGHSFLLGAMQSRTNLAGFRWHWSEYASGIIIPSDAKGVWLGAKLRLVHGTNPDLDLSQARFIASMGANVYDNVAVAREGAASSPIMQPRMKYVTPDWRWFSGSTLSEDQLRSNPPPPAMGSRSGTDAGINLASEETPGVVVVNDATTGRDVHQYEYTGTWATSSGVGQYQGDDHWTQTPGSGYQIRFRGSQIRLYGVKAMNGGVMAVSINDGPEVLVDTYAARREDKALLFQSSILLTSENLVKVRHTGTKNKASAGMYITADKAEIAVATTVTPSATPAPTLVPDPVATDTRLFMTIDDWSIGRGPGQIEYQGAWLVRAGSEKYQGTDRWSAAAGATYMVRFTSNQVRLYGIKGVDGGVMAVSLNGGPEVMVDTYAPVRQDQALLYESPVLATTGNVVSVRVTGTKTAASMGINVSLDKIEISQQEAPGEQGATPRADINGDSIINDQDTAMVLSHWARTDKPLGDVDQDGTVGPFDLGWAITRWGR